MEKKNITYLFGAGASANAIPVVKNFRNGIKIVLDKIKKININFGDIETRFIEPKFKLNYYYKQLLEDLEWLYIDSENHATIDTFAKILYIQNKIDKLKKLKIALSIFFKIIQMEKKDNRYDTFYASIFDTSFKFPENLNIISWNYDYQFEISGTYYLPNMQQDNTNASNIDILGSKMWLGVQEKNYNVSTHGKNRFFKLNGSVGFINNKYHNYIEFNNFIISKFNIVSFENILQSYVLALECDIKDFLLSFSWEQDLRLNSSKLSIIEEVKNSTKETEILVIIGYSLPFFNRKVDSDIIRNMTSLKKVIIQDKSPNSVKDRFTNLLGNYKNIEIQSLEDVDQFFIPNEL